MTISQKSSGYVARLEADELQARRVANLLSESLEPGSTACAAFARPDGRWQVDVYFKTEPEPTQLRALVKLAAGEPLADTLVVQRTPPRDWVSESLAGLKPVHAGRFVVHGADRKSTRLNSSHRT